MSVKLYGWAWRQRGIGSTARLVLLALAERADNRKHECFPTQTQLAADTELQAKAVGRAVKHLEDLGLVSRQRRRRQDGSRTSDLYRLHTTVELTDSRSGDSASHDSASGDSGSSPMRPRVQANQTESPDLPDTESEQEEPVTIPSLHPSPTHHSFDEFWAIYPRKKDKAAAERAWAKAVKKNNPERILEAAAGYARQRATEDPKFTKYPASWLNAGAWDDEPDQPQQALTSTNQRLLAIAQEYRAQENDHAAIGSSSPHQPHRGLRSA